MRVLRALDARHPSHVDAAVNGALAPLRAPARRGDGGNAGGDSASSSEGGSSGDEEEGGGGGSVHAAHAARHREIFAVVQEAFGGGGGCAASSARAVCGDTALTLGAALGAPAAGVRRMVGRLRGVWACVGVRVHIRACVCGFACVCTYTWKGWKRLQGFGCGLLQRVRLAS